MKICVLTDAWTPVWGGGQEHIWQVYTRLAVQGHQVDIVVPNLTAQDKKNLRRVENHGNLRIIRFGPAFIFPNLFGRFLFVLNTFYFTLSTKYDWYHSHSPSTSLCLPLLKLLGRRVAYTVHGKGKDLLGGGLVNKLGVLSLLNNLLVYWMPYDVLFSAAASSIERKPRARKLIIIGNGVDVAEFDKEKATPDPKHFTILCIGRRDPVKGLELLEQAVILVQKKYPQVRLNLVSGRKRTARDFKTADLYVLPSLSEGLPIVILEAMAASLPIVATAVGDVPKLLSESGAGQVVKPGEISALAIGIEQSIRREAKLREMGTQGYHYVKKHFTWKEVTKLVFEGYQSLKPTKTNE